MKRGDQNFYHYPLTRREVFELHVEGKGIEVFGVTQELGMSDNSSRASVCPLCGYISTVTNIHRHCRLAPLEPQDAYIRPQPVRGRHMSLNMFAVDLALAGGDRAGDMLPDYEKYVSDMDVTQEQWIKLIRDYLEEES